VDEDDSAPQAPGTDEAGPADQPRCVSVAWHGGQCKNTAKAGQETCSWHDPKYLKRARDRFDDTGQDDPNKWRVQCTAMVTTDRETGEQRRCGRNAVRGLDRCPFHGGNHPAAREMGERVMKDRVEQHRLKALIEEHGLNEDEALNPLLQLQKLGIETLAVKQFFLEEMSKLEGMVYDDRLGIEQVRQMVQLYERAAERATRLMVDMARLDIDNRLAKITERQGDIIATILEKVLSRLNLGDEVRESAKGYLTEEFRQLEVRAG